jgi:hypothetical protein
MKVRTTNRKGRHLSTVRTLQLLIEYGVDTPDGFQKLDPGTLTASTLNRHLRRLSYDHERMVRQPPAVRFQAEHSNALWHFDMSPSDLKQLKVPPWIDADRQGAPTSMLFSVVDDRSGVAYQEYRCVYGEDAETAVRFLFNAMAAAAGGGLRPSLTQAARVAAKVSGRDGKTALQPNQKTTFTTSPSRTTHALHPADICTRYRRRGRRNPFSASGPEPGRRLQKAPGDHHERRDIVVTQNLAVQRDGGEEEDPDGVKQARRRGRRADQQVQHASQHHERLGHRPKWIITEKGEDIVDPDRIDSIVPRIPPRYRRGRAGNENGVQEIG